MIPKFASEVAARLCELRNRDTSVLLRSRPLPELNPTWSSSFGSGGRNRTDCAFRHQGMSLISARCLSPRRLVPGLKLHGGAAVHPWLRELAEGRRLDRHAWRHAPASNGAREPSRLTFRNWRKAAGSIRSAGARPTGFQPAPAARPVRFPRKWRRAGELESHALRHHPLSRRRQAALLVHSPIGRDGRTRTCILRLRTAALIRLSYVTVCGSLVSWSASGVTIPAVYSSPLPRFIRPSRTPADNGLRGWIRTSGPDVPNVVL